MSTSASFRWPPAPLQTHPPTLEEAPRATHPAQSAGLLAAIEDFWFAPTAKPLSRRMAESGWRPDGLAVYCNRCGVTIGPFESDEFGCSRCRGERLPWGRFVRLGAYADPLGAWIREVKFTRWRRQGIDLGRLLAVSLVGAGLSPEGGNPIAVTPVPMSRQRHIFRGIDHAAVLAEGVARALGAPLVRGLAVRRRPSQRSLPACEREKSVAGSFTRLGGVDFTGWTVVVVDDVRTTGATLREACLALRSAPSRSRSASERGRRIASQAPAAIWAAVAAVTPEPG